MIGIYLKNLRETHPLIHNITNYVTVNDVANMILACGASPIMTDEPKDVEAMTSICNGLNINIGTLHASSIVGMKLAGETSNKLGYVTLLDPVGAGATPFRTETALGLMQDIHFDIIRGNISEIRTLALGTGNTRGVDAAAGDAVTEDNLEDMIRFAKEFAKETGAVIAMTGAIDLVADSERCYVIRNGRAEMGRITGTGCQLSGLMTAFASANKDHLLDAAATSVIAMGVCGEIGFEHLQSYEGNATYRNRIIDAMDHLTSEELERRAKYEIR